MVYLINVTHNPKKLSMKRLLPTVSRRSPAGRRRLRLVPQSSAELVGLAVRWTLRVMPTLLRLVVRRTLRMMPTLLWLAVRWRLRMVPAALLWAALPLPFAWAD